MRARRAGLLRPVAVVGLACCLVCASPRLTASQPASLPQRAILQQPENDRQSGDQFGHAVAVHGTHMVVGAPGDDERGLDAGAAYVFVRRDGVWTFEAKLAPAGLMPGDAFGSAVALDQSSIVVGAPGDDRVTNAAGAQTGTMVDRGAAYVFVESGTDWVQTSRLQPVPPVDIYDPSVIAAGDHFGAAVAIRGTIFVGAPDTDLFNGIYGPQADSGAVYIFDGTTVSRLYPPLLPRQQQAGLRLGHLVRVTDDAPDVRVLVGGGTGVSEYARDTSQPTLWTGTGRGVPPSTSTAPTEGAGFAVASARTVLARTCADGDGRRLERAALRRVTPEGRVSTLQTFAHVDGTAVWSDGHYAFRCTYQQIFARALDGTESFLAGQRGKPYTDGVGIDVGFGRSTAPCLTVAPVSTSATRTPSATSRPMGR